MGFKYAHRKEWNRKSLGYFLNTLAALLLLAFQAYYGGPVGVILEIVSIALFLVGLTMGIYYRNIQLKDYIQIEDGMISIHRGLIIPRKRILFTEVKKIIEVSTVMEIHMKNDRVYVIYPEWLTANDLAKLKAQLRKKDALLLNA